MANLNKALWLRAVFDEMIPIIRMATFDFVSHIPDGRHALPTKWVWAIKRGTGGKIEKFGVRCLARGDSQQKGIDYNETFAPVASLTTLRIVLSIAARLGLSMDQMDVISAFLNGLIDTIVYLTQPEGFSLGMGMVCILHKSIYGLCQADRIWYRLQKKKKEYGITSCMTLW